MSALRRCGAASVDVAFLIVIRARRRTGAEFASGQVERHAGAGFIFAKPCGFAGP